MNLRAFWEGRVQAHPHKTFLSFEGERISYGQLDARINQAANSLLELGVRKGDRVCLLLPNAPEFLACWLGLAKIGAAMVPINTRFTAMEARYLVTHSEAAGLIVHPAYLPAALEVRQDAPHLQWLACTGDADLPETVIPHDRRVAKMPETLQPVALAEDDLAAVIYTSGTTGFPKGAMHVQGSFPLVGEAFTLAAGLGPADRLMIVLPLYHINAQFYSTMGAIAAGASLVLIRDFSASRFWSQAVNAGVTQFNFIGAVGRMLLARPESEFRPEHTIRVANGAGISPGDSDAFTQRFKIPHVIDGYGLTEVPRVCQNPIGGRIKPGSMGLPARHPDPAIPFSQMRIVDERGQDVPPGITGELIVRSPVMMRGYFRDPERTREAIRDGWFYTGDYASRDADGYFFFVDRKKDIIRRRGENISAREVETALNAHAKVAEAAVIAVPSELGEDEVMACIVLRSEETLTPEEVVLWCRDRLAGFKVPRFVQFREALPKTSTQRTQKAVLKAEPDLLATARDMEPYKKSLGL